MQLVQAGLRSKLSAIMEINKCDEAAAQKELERIAEDGQITGQDIDWTQTDGGEEQDDSSADGEEGVDDGPSGEPAPGGNSGQ